VDRARIAVLEADRRYSEAASIASRTWVRAGGLRLFNWQALVAPELARVALRAADDTLRRTIHEGLDKLPNLDGTTARSCQELATAMTGERYDETIAVAARVAEEAASRGDALLQITAIEEGAVALAAGGDRDAARARAREALELAGQFGADGVASRVGGRLRAVGVRLAPTTTRSRPKHGWGSLTPTEERIVGLVVGGATGPEIGRELYVSPRTVQTHVSHALAKLGLSNRLELVAAAAARQS
jgi:DNA-binding CsgD family transcriptional regulator